MTFRDRWGIDLFDLVLHLLATGLVMGGIEEVTGDDALVMFAGAGSLVLLAIRRQITLWLRARRGLTTGEMAAERVAELENRVADLEAQQSRNFELEERLEFAERLLARSASERVGVAEKGEPK
jgi:hypothetical protein